MTTNSLVDILLSKKLMVPTNLVFSSVDILLSFMGCGWAYVDGRSKGLELTRLIHCMPKML